MTLDHTIFGHLDYPSVGLNEGDVTLEACPNGNRRAHKWFANLAERFPVGTVLRYGRDDGFGDVLNRLSAMTMDAYLHSRKETVTGIEHDAARLYCRLGHLRSVEVLAVGRDREDASFVQYRLTFE